VAVWSHAATASADLIRTAKNQPKKKGKAKAPAFDIAGEETKMIGYKMAEAEIWRQYSAWAVSRGIS
jgi:hypothetical protein